MYLERAKKVIEIEGKAVLGLVDQLGPNFSKMVETVFRSKEKGRIILTGMGKSGIVCRKIAATLSSTGTPALFLHPAEAIHGDLGMIVEGDTVIAVSNSGETEELVHLIEYIKRQEATLIAITGNAKSKLATHADVAFTFSIDEEGCPVGLAPMASTTAVLVIGDALAAALMVKKGFTSADFSQFHPGGKLGKRLLQVSDLMHSGDEKPLVDGDATLAQTLIEMSQKRLGMTAVRMSSGELGFISDGDIRRSLEKHGSRALEMPVEQLATSNPRTIRSNELAPTALHLMEQHQITSLLVLDDSGEYVGAVHLHDLWKMQLF